MRFVALRTTWLQRSSARSSTSGSKQTFGLLELSPLRSDRENTPSKQKRITSCKDWSIREMCNSRGSPIRYIRPSSSASSRSSPIKGLLLCKCSTTRGLLFRNERSFTINNFISFKFNPSKELMLKLIISVG